MHAVEDRGDLGGLEAMLRVAVEDEESEAAAYYRLASMASSEDLRDALRSIAEDSVVHAEVLRGLLRAIERIRAMRVEEAGSRGDLLEALQAHHSIEVLAGASYSDMKEKARVGSMRAVLEAIEREEAKHERIVRSIIERLENK